MKIPNRIVSPAHRDAGGSRDDSSEIISTPSFLGLLERPDQLGAVQEERVDASQANVSLDANAKSWHGNDFRSSHNAHDKCDGPVPGSGKEHLSTDEDTKKTVVSQSTVSPPRNTLKLGKVSDASISPMSALIESCVNYAKANAPFPVGDDVGMHLLASVAAGEMIKCELASPSGSPHRNLSSVEPSCKADDFEVKPFPLDSHSSEDDLSEDVVSGSTQKDHFEGCVLTSSKGDDKTSLIFSSERPVQAEATCMNSSFVDVDRLVVPSPGSNNVTNELAAYTSDSGMSTYVEEGRQTRKNALPDGSFLGEVQDAKWMLIILPHTSIQSSMKLLI